MFVPSLFLMYIKSFANNVRGVKYLLTSLMTNMHENYDNHF